MRPVRQSRSIVAEVRRSAHRLRAAVAFIAAHPCVTSRPPPCRPGRSPPLFDAEALSFAPIAAERARAPGGGSVEALCLSPTHSFTKRVAAELTLLTGLGVEGDAHCGPFDLHMGRRGSNPPPNLRQVHLFPGELADALKAEGFALAPGAIGENMLTRGVDLVNLPRDTRLVFPAARR